MGRPDHEVPRRPADKGALSYPTTAPPTSVGASRGLSNAVVGPAGPSIVTAAWSGVARGWGSRSSRYGTFVGRSPRSVTTSSLVWPDSSTTGNVYTYPVP